MLKPVFSYGISQGSGICTYPQAFLPVPQDSCLELHLPEIYQTSRQKSRLPIQNRYIPVPYLDDNPAERDMQEL